MSEPEWVRRSGPSLRGGTPMVDEARGEFRPGPVVLFGSGETAASAPKAYRRLFASLARPVRVSILETPAGFEPNSDGVAGQVATFLETRLQEFAPETTIVSARKRGTAFSPDDPAIVSPLLSANAVYMGAGSPTYAVRQLEDSLAWHTVLARHRLGAGLIVASASVLAVGACVVPVYEIYKVGEDIHWKAGLDLFGCYGLSLAFVPHWDNSDGGAALDTSRCFMGQSRFSQLLDMLPPAITVVGIGEHTQLSIDLAGRSCRVSGRGTVTIITGGLAREFEADQLFALDELGPFRMPQEPWSGIPVPVWERAMAAEAVATQAITRPEPPSEVLALVQAREEARDRRDWGAADALRERVGALGWTIHDTPDGAELLFGGR